MRGQTMVYEVVSGCLLYVGTGTPPSVDEWEDYLAFIRALPDTWEGVALIIPHGAVPTAAQRQTLRTAIDGRRLRSAVLTDSVVVRGAVTAFSWFQPGYRSFEPCAMSEAIGFLGYSGPKADILHRRALELIAAVKPAAPLSLLSSG